MSYDFVVVTPEAAGLDDGAALAAAVAICEGEDVVSSYADPRLSALVADLEASGAADEEAGWVSVWPLEVGSRGLAVPTTYTDPDSNLVTLLRLAARRGLVLVDLTSKKVDRPITGTPVGVKVGDGTRLGALTYERLESLLDDLPASDPWIILERDTEVYAQALRRDDGSFVLEYRDGSPESHFGTTLSGKGAVLKMLWAWVEDEPTWNDHAKWERVQF